MDQITPKNKSPHLIAMQISLNDPEFIKRLEGTKEKIALQGLAKYETDDSERLAVEFGIGDDGVFLFENYFHGKDLEWLRSEIETSLDPVLITTEDGMIPEFRDREEEREFKKSAWYITEGVQAQTYPVCLRLSPHIGKQELINYINDNWDDISSLLKLFGEELKFKEGKNALITPYVMRLARTGKSVEEIVDIANEHFNRSFDEVFDKRHIQDIIRAEEKRIIQLRQMRKKG